MKRPRKTKNLEPATWVEDSGVLYIRADEVVDMLESVADDPAMLRDSKVDIAGYRKEAEAA